MGRENKKRRSFALGQKAEEQALRFLEESGYTVLRKNFRSTNLVSQNRKRNLDPKTEKKTTERRGGDIDLIVRKANTIVFVEVKFRSSNEFGDPLEQIRNAQKKRIIQLAELFMDQYPEICREIDEFRFDYIALTPQKTSRNMTQKTTSQRINDEKMNYKKETRSKANKIFQIEHVENAFDGSGFS